MNHEVTFILDPNDIDSYIACEYINYYLKDKLGTVVIDGEPTSRNRYLLNNLINLFNKQLTLGINNVQIASELSQAEYYIVVCCSKLTKIANAVSNNRYINWLFMPGGYIGNEIDSIKTTTTRHKMKQSPILNKSGFATDVILSTDSSQIGNLYLMTENILCSGANKITGKLWKYDKLANKLFKKYNRINNPDYMHKVNHLITSREALDVTAILGSYNGMKILDTNINLQANRLVKFEYLYPECSIQPYNTYNKNYWYASDDIYGSYRGCFMAYIK